ncbi:MAG: hypothetical protein HOW97_34060 [Catenulispora sp.]|nr:hypothetical protein [Catenulispora sp.]
MTDSRVHRIDVEQRPDGAVLTPAAEHYEELLKDLFGVLAESPELLDDLVDLVAGDPPANDPHAIDRPSRDDKLAEQLVRALPVASRSIRLHRPAAVTLRERLGAALGRRWAGRRAA